jgi:zinc protease
MILKKRFFYIFTLALGLYFALGPGLSGKSLLAMPPVHRMVLPNQLVLLFAEDHSLPFLTLQLLVDAGSRKDPADVAGLANITAKGLLRGTARRTVTAINEELDFLGASLSASCGRDFSTLNLRILKKDLDPGIDLFLEALTQPIFPEEELRRQVAETLASIQSEEDQPGEVADKLFQKNLFPTSPYGHPVEGTPESLARILRASVIQFYRDHYHPGQAILAVTGDLTLDEVKTKLLSRLARWPQAKTSKEPMNEGFAKGPKTIPVDRQISQANIILGQGGVSRENPDYYALSVMNYILGGGGFSSRLMEVIREEKGLAYSVFSFFDAAKYSGSFQIVLQTKNASAQEAISLARQQAERIRKEPVSAKELAGAQKYLVGSFPMRLDTQGKLVHFLTRVEYYGLGLDYPQKYSSLIQSVSREEVLRVAQKYLHPEEFFLVVVANLKEAGME